MKTINYYTIKLVKEKDVPYNLKETTLDSSSKAKQAVKELCQLKDLPFEKCGILALDTQKQIKGIHVVAVGGINEAEIDIRTLFQHALLNNATSIIVFHNHPSGSKNISEADKAITKQLEKAGNILNIKVIDHIIYCSEDWQISLAEQGYITV